VNSNTSMAKKNTFKVQIPDIGSPIIELKYQIACDIDNLHLFKEEFEKIIDKYKVNGVL